MNLIIYNDLDLANETYEKGFEKGFSWFEGTLIAKYFRWVEGFGEQRTKKKLVQYAEQNDKYFNYVRSRRMIAKMVKRATRDGLIDTGEVTITKPEIEKIRMIRNFKYQKMVLAILLLSKRKTNRGYINLRDWPLIKRIVSRKITNAEIQNLFSFLYSTGYSEPVQASQKISIIEEGEVIFHIKNNKEALDLIQSYRGYCGGELGYCKQCQKEFVKENNRQMLCKDCSSANRLAKYKRYNSHRKEHTTN